MDRTTDSTISIQYIYNSGYTIDTGSTFVVIDYWKGDLILPKNRTIVFIVTHGHEDHYNPAIFSMEGAEDAYYILSDDIAPPRLNEKVILLGAPGTSREAVRKLYDTKHVYRTHPGDSFRFAGLECEAFGSTDLGISIYFELEGIAYFHSGDLNAWKWASFSPEDQKKEVEDFKAVLDKIRDLPVDIAFGVVDPRLGDNAFLGPDLLIDALHPQLFLPMHFRGEPGITARYVLHRIDDDLTQVQEIRMSGDIIRVRI